MGSAIRSSKPPAKKKQTKITSFTTSVKTKPKSNSRPNASITSYFKKAADEELFIGDGVAADVVGLEEKEDIYGADDLFGGGGSKSAKREEDDRFNEEEAPVKRRKLGGGDKGGNRLGNEQETGRPTIERGASPESSTTKEATNATNIATDQKTSRGGNRRSQKPASSRKRNPFLDDSDDEDTDCDGNDVNHHPGRDEVKQKGTYRTPFEKQHAVFRGDGLTFREVAPLLKEETSKSNIWQQESGDNGHGPDDTTADLDQDYGLEDFGDSFAGEEFREMRFIQEQTRLEAEAAGVDYEEPDVQDTSLMEECCPICNGSLAGVSESQATAHVNACLDGNPTPLTTTSSSPARNAVQKPDKDKIDSPEVIATRCAKAAVPRPGQAIPFKLGGADSGSGDAESGSATTSAFAKLMSGHAEDAAWATAAATETSSRGMPAYKRTCPFYKIMPNNFSICVDAFRYGAVKDCHAYFLSHFHSDHYIGLTASWSHGPIYCSRVTGSLVKSRLKTAAQYVVELEFDERVPVPETNGVFVTMIPANHCPGSSLFLFEKVIAGGKTQRILHCGDFRACPEHIAHPQLRPNLFDAAEKRFKEQTIDVCYLDTTYLNPRYSFPPQDDVIRACAELCVALNDGIGSDDESRWNSLLRRREGGAPNGLDSVSKFFKSADEEKKNKKNKVNRNGLKKEEQEAVNEDNPPKKDAFTAIQNKPPTHNRLLVICGTYSIGKERICIAIAQALKTKIFASPAKIRMCQQLNDPELASLMTSDPREAQVHMQMLMEIRAETLAEYLESYRGHFTKVVGFRPSGWNYSPGSSTSDSSKTKKTKTPAVEKVLAGSGSSVKAISANLAPGSVPTTHLLHGPAWRTRFSTEDLTPQRGSSKDAMCFGVPYSEHSSFRELALFLMALRIDRVVPTVNVGSEQSRKRMKGWTDRWLAERKRGGVVDVLLEGEEEKDGGKEVVLWEGKDRKGGGVYW